MPQRILRPGLTTSKRFNRCSWPAQSLYARLLTLVDDYGRFEADPQLVDSYAFPFGGPDGQMLTSADICEQMRALADKKLLVLYEIDGKQYLQLTAWKERIRSESKCPAPPGPNLPTIAGKCLLPTPTAQ